MEKICTKDYFKYLRKEDVTPVTNVLGVLSDLRLSVSIRGSSAIPLKDRGNTFYQGYSDIDLLVTGNRENDFYKAIRLMRAKFPIYFMPILFDSGATYADCDSEVRCRFLYKPSTLFDLNLSRENNPAFAVSRSSGLDLLINHSDRRFVDSRRSARQYVPLPPLAIPQDIQQIHLSNPFDSLSEALCEFVFNHNL